MATYKDKKDFRTLVMWCILGGIVGATLAFVMDYYILKLLFHISTGL